MSTVRLHVLTLLFSLLLSLKIPVDAASGACAPSYAAVAAAGSAEAAPVRTPQPVNNIIRRRTTAGPPPVAAASDDEAHSDGEDTATAAIEAAEKLLASPKPVPIGTTSPAKKGRSGLSCRSAAH